MRELAAELKEAHGLRPDLSVGEAADIIGATNSPELFILPVRERGWRSERYERRLADTWKRLLLPPLDSDSPTRRLIPMLGRRRSWRVA
jgi:hypothetical protein